MHITNSEVILLVGYIDVGGGLRAVYGTGVLDYCLDSGIDFPYLIGVSAGSGNIASYLAHQRGRSLKFYTDFAFRSDYMSMRNFAKSGSYINLDYIYSVLSNGNGECPLDYDAMNKNNAQFVVVSTNAESGKAEYFTKEQIKKDSYDIFKTSCCIPVVNKAYGFGGSKYYDGGLSDPIPVRKAFHDGCDKVVVCLTRPIDYRKKHRFNQRMCDRAMREYPAIAKTLMTSVDKYNDDLEYIKKLQSEGKVLIVAPETCCGVETLSRKRSNIVSLYNLGYSDGEKILKFVQE